MPPDLADYLAALKSTRSALEFVAAGADGEMLSYHVFYKGLRKMCGRIGLALVSPHELRHSSTELLVEAGASAEDLRRQLNHKSLTSAKCNMHRPPERLRSIADRIEVGTPTKPTGRRLQLVK